MQKSKGYLMESEEEAVRLDLKTDPKMVKKQGRWAGLKPGMRLGDFGCGAGITSYHLNQLVQPGGSTVGIDISPQRIEYAESHYEAKGLSFVLGDIRKPLRPLGQFDFIWIRFVLEWYRSISFEIVKHVASALKPGGILFLGDLDYNMLTHYEMPEKLERAMYGIMKHLEEKGNFDPYIGRKLYSFLYDLGYLDIKVEIMGHHLLYGNLKEGDIFNWTKKVEVGAKKSGYSFNEYYSDGFAGFHSDYKIFFYDPRRFTYTPIICVRGRKPLNCF